MAMLIWSCAVCISTVLWIGMFVLTAMIYKTPSPVCIHIDMHTRAHTDKRTCTHKHTLTNAHAHTSTH
jgi:hypothetical protein